MKTIELNLAHMVKLMSSFVPNVVQSNLIYGDKIQKNNVENVGKKNLNLIKFKIKHNVKDLTLIS